MPEQRVRDPAHSLSGIKQAIYILRCISDGDPWSLYIYVMKAPMIRSEYIYSYALHLFQ
jgi:hypothetical protein